MKAPSATLLVLLLAGCAASGPDRPVLSPADRDTLDRTAEAHQHDSPVPTPAATTAPAGAVEGRSVVYAEVEGKPVTGYLARPAGSRGPLPGLIVIHEWWGLNDNVRAEARRLAAEGYVVLAVDLYGGVVATEVPDALKLSQQLTANRAPGEANLRAAYEFLERVEKAPRIGTIGWCLGGGWSLRAAILLPSQVDATVIYYGNVRAGAAELAPLKMPVLGLFAGNDRVVPAASVADFQATMERLGKDVDVHVYPDAQHAFANPSGTAYQAAAAEDAWRRTTAFLREHLAK